MSSSLGRVTAHLAEPTDSLPPEMVALINQNVKPPTPVTADEIQVRAMYIVSDQINSFGGRFPVEEHHRLAELLIDSPVLVGHRKDRLPVGRNFHAELVERDGRPWVKCYFYWLRSADADESLGDNIDGGIYKECSIAFTFNSPTCSICGRDIRRCEHEPFETYEKSGTDVVCHFDYHEIEKVLETSLVYRGAVPKTSLTNKLRASGGPEQPSDDAIHQPALVSLDSISDLDPNDSFLIVPRYDGLPLTACLRDGALSLSRLDGCTLATDLSEAGRPAAFRPSEPVYGVLIGYRGRERCSRSQLEQYLKDRTGPVSRLVFNVYPHQGLLTLPRTDPGARLQIRIVPHRLASPKNIEPRAREIMTRDGVEIWPLSRACLFTAPDNIQAYRYQPVDQAARSQPNYRLEFQPSGNRHLLTLTGIDAKSGSTSSFEIINFEADLLRRRRCFAARPVPRQLSTAKSTVVLEGEILSTQKHDGSLVVQTAGESGQSLVLRPIRLGGRDLFMFSMVSHATKADRSTSGVTIG